ncbi:MAG: HD domain-containing protein [Chitinivibrionia bacterium]|nr:HD domain-containing protein [Chitinivibrionia bacterium]
MPEKNDATVDVHNSLLKAMAELVELRDDVTGGHIERTQRYLSILFLEMQERGIYSEETSKWEGDIATLLRSSQLHDIGKIAVRDCVLLKPGKLTEEEFEQIKTHALEGEKFLEKIQKDANGQICLEYARIFAGYHHEKWDGSGYPRGLKGENIPLLGRLMAIVDVYDALVVERPYKKAFPHEEAVKIIKEGSGTHFDPILVDLFLDISEVFEAILALHAEGK